MINSHNLLIVSALFLLAAVAALAFRAQQRRGYGPTVVGLAASLAILSGKFYLESAATMYAALGILIAASIWNSWPIRPAPACPRCAVSDELVKERGL